MTLLAGSTIMAAPAATAQFVWRYQLPAIVLLPLAAALAWTALRSPQPAEPDPDPDPYSDADPDADDGTRATASTD